MGAAVHPHWPVAKREHRCKYYLYPITTYAYGQSSLQQ